MKIFISADLEGVAGATSWSETEKGHAEYPEFREQMTAEVVAACEGALNAGASEIVIKDAHWTGRNLIAARLPREARLIRGWTGDPYSMMAGLDESFQAALMLGYHSRAGSDASPLAHTLTGRVAAMTINDRPAAEFLINAYTAGLCGVPVVFLSGDAGICQDASDFLPCLATVAVMEGLGAATDSIHPTLAVERIRAGVEAALRGDVARCQVTMPAHFVIRVSYREHALARKASFYPGAQQVGPHAVQFEADAYFEILRFIMFGVSMNA
ncbi:MAG: M55 family metallopeptidase [Anaerolineae bacterium]|nr:M55 family metallopeptidase [Anaerolineae bacterium]